MTVAKAPCLINHLMKVGCLPGLQCLVIQDGEEFEETAMGILHARRLDNEGAASGLKSPSPIR